MFITHPTWKIAGAPNALLAPAIPWYSALLDISQPCFLITADTAVPRTHVRLFSNVDGLLTYVRTEPNDNFLVYALSQVDDDLAVSIVTAIASYPCPQTGVKMKVYFDDNEQPWPAHSGQPQFSRTLKFKIEASFS
ncbi:hypothetical protein [Herbaspirillum robiniae]|uniref:hypothetical protein n=1 Tax=Herbaspirillum robiniae TaxID=2014887 RepID=UPI0011E4CE1B|nr:hypothetical protein [Herbaspirillum robiniae]